MKSPKKLNLSMLLYFIWQIIGVQIVLVLGILFIGCFFPNMKISDYYINLLILQDAALLLVPILLGIKLLGDKAQSVISIKGLSARNVLYIVMTGFLMLPVMLLISSVTSFFFPDTTGDAQNAVLSAHFSVGFLIMAIVPAILEETMFRGLVYGSLKKFGRKRAIALSAFYFGLFHLNGYQIPYAVFSGIVLAVTAEYAGTILAPMLLHFTINGVQVGIYYYYASHPVSLTETALEAESSGLAASELLSLGLTAAVFAALLLLTLRSFIKYNKNRTADKEEQETEVSQEKYRFTDIYFILSVIIVGAYVVLMPYLEAYLETLA